MSSGSSKPLGKTVATERNRELLNYTSRDIAGTAEHLIRQLKRLDGELKDDEKGAMEFEQYLTKLKIQRAEVAKRIKDNKEWIANIERAQGDMGSAELQYKKLLGDIQSIYDNAKEFHGQGIDMLIKEFGYHV